MIESDLDLIDMITGYQPAAAVTAGLETGLFDMLESDPAHPKDLARLLHVDLGSLTALLESLAALGVVEKSDHQYSNTSYISERVACGGPMASVIRKEALFAGAWQELANVVKTGEPVMSSWANRVSSQPATARSFLEALDVLARSGGPDLSRLPELAPNKAVVDVGGGLGTYSLQLATAGSRVVLVDLPEVIEWATEFVGGAEGVNTVATDLFTHPSIGVEESSADAVLVSHMLHDLKEDKAVDLLRRSRRALKPDGYLVVNDFAGDSGPGAFGPLFDVMMRVETGGAAHSLETLETVIGNAGFVDMRRANFDEPLTVLIATNPAGTS